jgi:hypothetical protein
MSNRSPLKLEIASPCSVSWASMSGDDRVRHCSTCKKNVYELSGMSRDEIEKLIQSREGQVCVRYYKRHDGTVLTSDCPVGLAAVGYHVKRVTVKTLLKVAGVTAALLGGTAFASHQRWLRGTWVENVPVLNQFVELMTPEEPVVMGAIGPTPRIDLPTNQAPTPTQAPLPNQPLNADDTSSRKN